MMIRQAPHPAWSCVSAPSRVRPAGWAHSNGGTREAKRVGGSIRPRAQGDEQDAPTDPIQARLAAAKAYKQKQQEEGRREGKGEGTEEGREQMISSTSFADSQSSADTQAFMQAQTDLQDAKATGNPEGTVEVTIERGFGAADTRSLQNRNTGSSTTAATWLQTTSTQSEGISKNLRAEEFTAEKEKRIRGQEIVIERAKGIVEGTRRKATTMDEYGTAQMFQDAELSIAADKKAEEEKLMAEIADMAAIDQREADEAVTQQAAGQDDEDTHKPAVATWGVFPRPQNISKTYGGGRNIRPGQALETEEEKEARKQRVAAALTQYRKAAGLDIEPEVEDAAMELYEQGQALFENGSLRAALEKYELACEMVPLKSKVGGLANFQKAVCLDSLGRNDEAYSIYKSLRGHSAPGVAKNSKRMMFGFQAAKDLKVDKMRAINDGSVDQWRGYFDRATDGTWAVYKRKEGEDEEEAAQEQRLVLLLLGLLYPKQMSSKEKEKGDSMGGSQTFRIVANPSSKASTILARFVGSKLPVDLTAQNAHKGHDAWTMKEERAPESGNVVNYVIDKNSLADDVSERAQYKGAPDGTITGSSKPSNYFILVKEKGDFVAVPVDQWVTFRYSAVNRKYDAQSLEEAEAAMKYRRMEAEKQDLVSLAKLGDLEKQERDAMRGVGKAGKGAKGAKAKQKEDPSKKDEPDSEDEWKDVKAEKLKKRNLIMAGEDGVGVERQSTALDFKDEYKPKNAEDWEHEIAADDDDLDMGDEEMLEDDLVEGGFATKRGLQSPSVSGDEVGMDGELSDGGMGDTSLRRKIERTLKKRIGEESDEDGGAADDLSDDDDEDDDVDALDAMASGDFIMDPSKVSQEAQDKAAKLKGKSKPSAEVEKGKKRKNEERPVLELEKKQKVLQTGVPTEDEIRSLLKEKKRMLLADIAAEFKKRLKNADDRKTFTSRVKAVAMLDPSESGKKRHLILKST